MVNYQKDDETAVPCGKCIPCLKKRISHWSFRLMQEERTATSAHFVTLTYANLEKNAKQKLSTISPNGFPSLCKRDLQLYFKRLRKLHPSGSRLKYYAVGEYGTKGFRPHYHIILFNADVNVISKAWTRSGISIGHVHVGTVTVKSVGYTLAYIMQGKWRPRHKRDDRTPEFSCMSKGIGVGYVLDPKWVKWHYSDLDGRMYCSIEEGKKIGMPRYYKQKLYDDETRKRIGEISREKAIIATNAKKAKIGADKFYHERREFILDLHRRGDPRINKKL